MRCWVRPSHTFTFGDSRYNSMEMCDCSSAHILLLTRPQVLKVASSMRRCLPTNVHSSLPQLSCGTWPCMPHNSQIQDVGAPGCDKPFSSLRSARFTTQWTFGCHVPDRDDGDVLTLLGSALSPVAWSPQFPVMSTATQNVSLPHLGGPPCPCVVKKVRMWSIVNSLSRQVEAL